MLSQDLRRIRLQLGCTVTDMGRALGLRGESDFVSRRYREWESGHREIPLATARLAEKYRVQGFIDAWMEGPDGERDVIPVDGDAAISSHG